MIALFLLLFASSEGGDRMLHALEDELARSRDRLSLGASSQGPYFVAYTVRETASFNVASSFGALTSKSGGRWRSLSVQVRVGDYALDNTNFVEDGRGGFEGGSLPTDDDYDAIR